MPSTIELDKNRLLIFHEGRKRRLLVGELSYVPEKDRYELFYDEKYVYSKTAISLGPHLDLFKLHHISEKGVLFPFFMDRIPVRENPAYEDYCISQGISVDEKNKIVLLGSIGKRGPSTFVFEKVYKSNFNIQNIILLRKELQITAHDFSEAFDINKLTLEKLESGKSSDPQTLKRLQTYLEFPEVALWQLQQTGGRVHYLALRKLIHYFQNKQQSAT